MRYGIVGASGTLGRVVVQHLLKGEAANSVNALVRKPDKKLQGLAGCKLITGGMFDAASVDGLARNADVIVNLAARNPGIPDEDRVGVNDFYAINALGAGIVAAAGHRWHKPVVHFSSVAVYETGQSDEGSLQRESGILPDRATSVSEFHDAMVDYLGLQLASGPIDEGAVAGMVQRFLGKMPHPIDAPIYGLSKLIGETLAVRLAGQNCVIRMSDVYGPGHESRGVITDHLNALRDDDHVVVDFDFRSSAFFVYIDDVCRLIVDIAAKAARAERLPTSVNFCGPRITEAEFQQSLIDLVERHGMHKTVTLTDNNCGKVDRRYSGEVYRDFFPKLSTTPFAEGLESTWLAGRG